MNTSYTKISQKANGEISVDESGNAGTLAIEHNRKYPYFVIAFCFCKHPRYLQKKMFKILHNLHKSHSKQLTEIKFYPTPQLIKSGCSPNNIKNHWEPIYDEIRNNTIDAILSTADGIFAGIVDKNKINYNSRGPKEIQSELFVKSISDYILPNINSQCPPAIVYDRGSLIQGNKMIQNKNITYNHTTVKFSKLIKYVDSLITPQIWASDIIAGSFYHAYQHDDFKYVKKLRPKFLGKGYFKLK